MTFVVLAGLTPIVPTDAVVRTLLLANAVTVLTARALKAEEVKPADAQVALENAQAALKRAAGTEAQDAQLVAQDKARAQLRVARHQAG